MEFEVKSAKRNEVVRMTSSITWHTTAITSLRRRSDGSDVALRTFFFELGPGSVRALGRKASQREIGGIWSLGGRLSALATVAARLVARRPIVQKKEWREEKELASEVVWE